MILEMHTPSSILSINSEIYGEAAPSFVRIISYMSVCTSYQLFRCQHRDRQYEKDGGQGNRITTANLYYIEAFSR